jgi:hypothetical protein
MGFISRMKSRVDGRSKQPRKFDLGKPIDHQALCLQSSFAMISIAALLYVLVPRLSFLNGGDPLKHAIKFYQQGNMFYGKGDLIEAERHFRQAIHINPRHAFALTNLVCTHSSLSMIYELVDIDVKLPSDFRDITLKSKGECAPYQRRSGR